jgi:hypothetical protein
MTKKVLDKYRKRKKKRKRKPEEGNEEGVKGEPLWVADQVSAGRKTSCNQS